MVLSNFSNSLVVAQDVPLILGVGILEVRDLALPVADRNAAIHKVDKDILHLLDCGVRSLEDCLLEALTPAVVARLVLLRILSRQLKVTDLDHDLVRRAIRGQADAHANLSDNFVLVIFEESQRDCLLLDLLFENLLFALRML